MRQVLQRAHLVLAQGPLATDQQHRAFCPEGIRDTGDGIGRAGASGHDGATGCAADPGVSIGGMCCHLFMPYIDEFDLAEKLQRVLRDGSLVHAYRQRAQLRIRTHYDWETVVDQYERLFARMCGQVIDEPRPAKQTETTEVSRQV